MWSKKRAECLLFLSLHTRQHITQQWGHSARHSHDTGRQTYTEPGKGWGSKIIYTSTSSPSVTWGVDVLGKQWMILVRRTRGTDSHWFYFTTNIRRLTRPITTLKTSLWPNPSSQLSWPLKTKEFRQQTKLCICRQYGQFKGNVNIHHRKREFPSMVLSFFVIVFVKIILTFEFFPLSSQNRWWGHYVCKKWVKSNCPKMQRVSIILTIHCADIKKRKKIM